ncbi:hypothetical protein Y032_0048g1666 [Ancylostoma ceylanicum]|nr:hypothetical protein Y032_0048g1666 [Ancylostoma ceylanicum]
MDELYWIEKWIRTSGNGYIPAVFSVPWSKDKDRDKCCSSYALTKQQLLSMDIVLHRLLHLNRVWLTSSKMASAAKPWLTDPISLQKKGLRKEMTAKLADVTAEEAERQSALVAEKVLSSVWFKNAKRVSVYTHTAGEIQTAKIIEESLKAGKHVFIPKV